MLIKRLGLFILDILEVIVFAVVIFLIVYLLILQPHKIKGASMEPNYQDGEYLLTDKLSYKFREPKRGEVIVFKAPGQNGEEYIKRIIALPYEKVSIKNNHIFINGISLDEDYIPSDIITPPGQFLNTNSEIVVPAESYLVLGDNRPFSSDSRTWGFIKKADITGKAWIIYWPPEDIGVVPEVNYSFSN